MSLITEANKFEGINIVSIFINPAQFNDINDFKNYPKTFEKDLEILSKTSCKIIFAPDNEAIYPKGVNSDKTVLKFRNILCDLVRSGHFDGVTTIVKILFDLIKPFRVFFGEKDFQQLRLIKTLTEQLDIKTNVVGCETIREPDGLAMSSRNKLMSDKERKSAKEIIKLLLWAKEAYSKFDFIQIRDEIKNRSKLIDSFKLEYFEIMNLEKFSSISKKNNETRAFIACRIGNIRLIDNIKL